MIGRVGTPTNIRNAKHAGVVTRLTKRERRRIRQQHELLRVAKKIHALIPKTYDKTPRLVKHGA